MLVHLSNLINHLLLLGLELRLILIFLLDELLNKLIHVLTHTIDLVIFCHQGISQLAELVLLALQLSLSVISLLSHHFLFLETGELLALERVGRLLQLGLNFFKVVICLLELHLFCLHPALLLLD